MVAISAHPDLILPPPVPLDLDGVRIAVRTLGPSSVDAHRTLLLCHGTPWSAAVWAPVARDLARDHRVILWDMPGYGSSEMGEHLDLGLPSQMGRLARLIRELGLHRPHVIAHDIGGAVALGAHLLHGAEYGVLGLWDAVTLDPWGSPFFRLVAQNRPVLDGIPAPMHRAMVREYIRGAAHRPLSEAAVDVLAAPWTGEVGQPAFSHQIAALRPEDTRAVAEGLGRVRCPVRIGWGSEDPWIPVGQADRLRSMLPQAPPVHRVDGAGHLVPLEAVGEVAGAIRRWVSPAR